jgi:hypothetical protein
LDRAGFDRRCGGPWLAVRYEPIRDGRAGRRTIDRLYAAQLASPAASTAFGIAFAAEPEPRATGAVAVAISADAVAASADASTADAATSDAAATDSASSDAATSDAATAV